MAISPIEHLSDVNCICNFTCSVHSLVEWFGMRCSCMVALYTILAAVQLICFVELIMEGGYTCVLQYGYNV